MDFFRFPKRSALGSHRTGNTTSNDTSFKRFEMFPKNLQIAESQRKQRITTNNEIAFAATMKSFGARQPRKSMLGTRKASRNSIIPPPCDLSLPLQDLDNPKDAFDSTVNDTLKCNESPTTIINDRVHSTTSSENERKFEEQFSDPFQNPFDRLSVKTTDPTSPVLRRNVPVREMLPFTFTGNDSSSVNEESILATTIAETTIVDSTSPVLRRNVPVREMLPCVSAGNDTILANEESILATTIAEATIADETSCFGSTLKDIANTCADRTIDEPTLRLASVANRDESPEENDYLFKMLDLVNTWIRRTSESVELYDKEVAALQEKRAQASEEIKRMENLKVTLMKQFPIDRTEQEDVHESDVKPMATIPENRVFSSPIGSPTKNYFQEMRSTIKFMKTPLTSRTRAPRQSVMLTPHSMSFCLKNQYEQLFG